MSPSPSASPFKDSPSSAPSVVETVAASASAGAQWSPSPSPEIAAWRQIPVAPDGPPAVADHTWTVDGDDAYAYLFGGRDSTGLATDLWRYDLAAGSWSQLQPIGDGPAARFGHTATWVPGVGLVIWSGQGSTFYDDIWAYDPGSNSWRQLPSSGDVPEARYGSCASLGPDGRLWISHGFTQDDGRFADTRAYDFATGQWTDMTPAGDGPIKRCLHDCFWSPDGQRLILYGGQTTGVAALGDIWAYDLATSAWQAGPQPSAQARQLYALAVLNGGALVFGGGSVAGGYIGDAWSIDESTLDLHAFDVAGGPPARSAAALIADALRHRVLLFGGENESGLLRDIWELGPVLSPLRAGAYRYRVTAQ